MVLWHKEEHKNTKIDLIGCAKMKRKKEDCTLAPEFLILWDVEENEKKLHMITL